MFFRAVPQKTFYLIINHNSTMKQTKSATPYVALLLGILTLIPYANHKAKVSQQIAVEVESKVTYLPKAQAALMPDVDTSQND